MQLFANNAISKLAANITSGATSIALTAGEGGRFPSPGGADYFLLTLYQMSGANEVNHEIVKVTARAGDTLTVVRGWDNTTARAFNAFDPVSLRITAAAMTAQAIGAQPASVTAPLTDESVISLDISTGDVFDVTIMGNRTINFTGGSAALDGKKVLLRIKQGSGSNLVTWGAGAHFGADIASITLSTAANKTDIVGIAYRHASATYDIIAFARGY